MAGLARPFLHQLIAVIQRDVTEAVGAALAIGQFQPVHRDRHRELMLDAGRRPLLCEHERPAGLLEEQAAEDRLHDAGFLVEGFLDEKRVVLNLPGAR